MSHSRVFWGLNGCWIIFRGNFKTQYWYPCFNMPLESLQTELSNKTYAIWKKIHTFFFLLRSSVLKLMYLCNFGSSISKIWSCSRPINFLLNATGLTWFGFLKAKLFPISHNDVIMDWFSRVNLYGVPCVIVSYFGFEIDTQELQCMYLRQLFTEFQFDAQRELWRFSHNHLFEMKFESLKKPYVPWIISPKILRTKTWNVLEEVYKDLGFTLLKF